MKFDEVVDLVGEDPLFETGLLLAGDVEPWDVQRQLTRWLEAGKVLQLRRGLYTLAPPYQKVSPHPFLIANRLVRGSYVSLQSVLANAGLIPEGAPVTTSATLARPTRFDTPLGRFDFRHVRRDLLFGVERQEVAAGQYAVVAKPEKALLDLLYLEPGADRPEYLAELRLQHLDRLDLQVLDGLAATWGKPKLLRAARRVAELAEEEASSYEVLR